MNAKKCKIIGCLKSSLSKDKGVRGYCGKHWMRIKRCGDPTKRTTKEKNEIRIYKNHCEMCLYDKKSSLIATTVFDKKYLNKVKKYKWLLTKGGYVRNVTYGVFLHKLILGEKRGLEIDHADRCPLNNRCSNLRFISRSQNGMNKWLHNNKSGVTGVYPIHGGWTASIKKDNKQKYLGLFKNIEDAISARKMAEEKYFSKYKGSPVVCLTWGVWDFMHKGHTNLLKKAREFCDQLGVIVSADDFIKKHKKEMPVHSLEDRINSVRPFADFVDTQSLQFGKKDAIKKYSPALLIVGSDHTADYGGFGCGVPIRFLPHTDGISSTILRKNMTCDIIKKGRV